MLVRTEAFRGRPGSTEPPPAVVELGVEATHLQPAVSTEWEWTHDLNALDDFMVIFAGCQNANPAFNSMTYDEVTANLTAEVVEVNRRTRAGWLPAVDLPAAGAGKDVAVNLGPTGRGLAVALPLRGAAQSEPAFNPGAGTATSIGPTAVTVAPGGAVLQFLTLQGDQEASLEAGAGETVLVKEVVETASGVFSTFLLSYKLNQDGSTGMSASWASSARVAQIVLGIGPA